MTPANYNPEDLDTAMGALENALGGVLTQKDTASVMAMMRPAFRSLFEAASRNRPPDFEIS